MQLKTLKSVDWGGLKHAYGRASDVPDQLQALLSPCEKTRTVAYEALFFNIVHQGTRYEAAVAAIPVLVEMLGLPDLPDAHQVVELLAYIAVGYDECHLPQGFDPTSLDGPWPDFIDDGSILKVGCSRADWECFGNGPEVAYRCYWAIIEQAESILAAFDRREDLREYFAHLLAWFPKLYPVTAGRLRLAGINGILATGLLERQLKVAPTTTPLLAHPDLVVRTAASIASARLPMDAETERALTDALERLDELPPGCLLFNDGDWRGWICMSLAAYSASQHAERLIRALHTCNAFEALEVTAALLYSVGHGPPEGLRREALQAIHDGPGWELLNYNELMHAHGFPDTKESLRDWLDGV